MAKTRSMTKKTKSGSPVAAPLQKNQLKKNSKAQKKKEEKKKTNEAAKCQKFISKKMSVSIRRLSIEEIMIATGECVNKANGYNLRPKAEKKIEPTKKTKITSSSTALTKVKNRDKLWKQLATDSDEIIKLNDIVCAKMHTYQPWPARVVNIYYKSNGIKAAWVLFFGTFQVGEVNISQCVPFTSCSELILIYCKGPHKPFEILENLDENREDFIKTLSQKQIYIQAIRDAEIYVNLPFHLSLLNQIKFPNNNK